MIIEDDIDIDGVPTIKGIVNEDTSTYSGYGVYNTEVSNGTISIQGGIIQGKATSGVAAGISNSGATAVTVTGTEEYATTITGTSDSGTGTGIYNKVGTLKLWNGESTIEQIDVDYPLITGSTYGVNAVTNSIFHFHDGKVVGSDGNAIVGVTPSLIDETAVNKTTSNSIQTATLVIVKTPTTGISESTLNLIAGNKGSVTYTYDGDGTPTVSTSNSNYATATINTSTKTVTITGVAAGTATITISFPAGTQYKEGTPQTIIVTVVAAKYESSGIYYTVLSNAVDGASSGGTIKVLDNATEPATTIDKNVTLNLNGKTITGTGEISIAQNYSVTISGSGTITNSVGNTLRNYGTLNLSGTATIQSTASNGYAISNSGTLNATSGTIKSIYRGIYNTGTTNINGATVLADDNGDTTVEGSTIGIRNITNGIVKVNSGLVKGKTTREETIAYGICNDSVGTNTLDPVTVNDGEVNAVSDSGYATGIWHGVEGNIKIAGGTVSATTGAAARGIQSYEGTITVSRRNYFRNWRKCE